MSRGTSLNRLKISNFKLDILLDITRAINENLSTLSLLSRFEQILTVELKIGKIVVFKFNQQWECILISGIEKNKICNIDINKCFAEFDTITPITNREEENFLPFDVIIPVFHKETPLAYILIGDIDEEQAGVSPTIKHLHFIQTLTNIIIVAIENKRLHKESIKQEALKKELELASKMQALLIPDKKSLPCNDIIVTDAIYLPHFDVGGDYFDFIELSNHETGFCIADVSGKGISAALLMSNFQANLRALFTPEISLTELVRKLNYIVSKNTKGEKFITIFIGKYNSKTRDLIYINAGHNPPVMYNAKSETIHHLKNGCVGLGMVDEIDEINKGYIKVTKSSKLICYTDGVSEIENENGDEFGTSEIEKIIKQSLTIDETLLSIIDAVNLHRGTVNYFDDITLIGIDFII